MVADIADLDDGDAQGEEKEGNPLSVGEACAQEKAGAEGGCEDLELVKRLEHGGLEVAGGGVLEIVLDYVEDGREGEGECGPAAGESMKVVEVVKGEAAQCPECECGADEGLCCLCE